MQPTLSIGKTESALNPARQVVKDWQATARTAAINPLRMSRVTAMVAAAMHDAVNGADPQFETYASDESDPSADAEAAAASAAHGVLSGMFPGQQASWDAALATSLANVPDGAAEDAGVALGAAVAQDILDARTNDGVDSVDPFSPTPGPGVWEPTPPPPFMLDPQFQNVTPFTLEARDQFNLQAPDSLNGGNYADDFIEVAELGRNTSTSRSADQTHSAHFWYEPPYDTWPRIGALVADDNGYSLHQTARLNALLNMAVVDGFIAGYYYKRLYAFWRPLTAIHKADTDGNNATIQDTTWAPLRPNPPHPDYPSTHSVTGAAAARILKKFTGSDSHSFCIGSITAVPAGSTRCFDSFTEASDENSASRVYVGIHFRKATSKGAKLGRKIGRHAFRNSLRPIPDNDCDEDSDF